MGRPRAKPSGPARPTSANGSHRGRRILAIAAGATVAAVLAWLWVRPAAIAVARDGNRNVLLVTIDTLRADALGSYGGAAATPNLDRLAAEGLRFTAAHAHTVVTLPSHTSILTGVYPFVHGVHDNAGYRLAPGATTIATLLKQAGYATGAFVGAFPLDSRWGLAPGVRHLRRWVRRDGSDGRFPDARAAGRQGGRRRSAVDPTAERQVVHVGSRVRSARAVSTAGAVRSAVQRKPVHGRGCIHGSRARTAIRTGQVGAARHAHRRHVGPWRGARQPWRADAWPVRVRADAARPADPGSDPAPACVRRVIDGHGARHIDLLPTVLDALGLQAPATVSGRSLLRALETRDATSPASYFESLSPFLNRGWAPLTGVIVGSEKYVDLPIPELYDLASDREEAHNLLPARDDRRRVLEARLREIAPAGAAASGARIQETSEARRQLQALGYVSGSTPPKARYTAEDDPKRLVDLDRMMQDGVALFQRGQLRDALNLYREVMARRPGMSASRLHAAYIEWEMGDPKAAVETLRKGLQAGADAPDMRVQLGIYLAESGSPADAVRLLSPLQQEAFPDLDGLNGLGIALAHLGRQADALAVFDRILQLDADNASACQNKGTVYLEQGNLGAAREALTRALQRDPNLARALNGLGVVEVRSGNRRGAIEPWKHAVEVDPRQYDTLFNLGVTLLELGDRAAARRYLEQFVRTAPPVFYRKDIEKVGEMLRRLPAENR